MAKNSSYYVDQIGTPFLYIEEINFAVMAGKMRSVISQTPKIVFVLRGSLMHGRRGHEMHALKPGSVMINLFQEEDLYQAIKPNLPGNIQALRITIDQRLIKKINTPTPKHNDTFGHWMLRHLPAYQQLQLPDEPAIWQNIEQLRNQLHAAQHNNPWQINTLARQLMIQLVEFCQQGQTANTSRILMADRIDQYIHEHLNQNICLSDLAEFVQRSEEHIARCYRQQRGTTIFQGIRQRRIKRAQYLLQCTDHNLTLIAQQTGFATLAHFSRTFKQETGLNATTYRRRCGDRILSESIKS